LKRFQQTFLIFASNKHYLAGEQKKHKKKLRDKMIVSNINSMFGNPGKLKNHSIIYSKI